MSEKSFRAMTAALISGAAGLSLDQYTKYVYFNEGTANAAAFSFFNGVIRSVLHENRGISFNIPIPTWITLLITGLALSWALALLIERARRGSTGACMILGIFIGGVIGNAFDRITLGFVRDWVLLFGRSAINIADILIGGSLLAWLLPRKKDNTY